MKKILSYIIKYILPLLMGIGIFVLLYKQFDMSEIVSILQSDMNIVWVIVSMLIGVISHLSRALRWQLQLRAINVTPSFGTLCNAIFGTYAFNLVIPRFGELWRCTYVADHEQASFSRIFGSMLSDRVADTLSVVVIVAFVFLMQMGVVNSFLAQNPELQSQVYSVMTSPWLYVVIFILVAVALMLWKRKGNNPLMVRVREILHNLGEGFNSVVSMKSGKKRFLLYTIMIWGCYFLQLYVCSWAFDWMHHITVLQALVLFVLGSIGMAVPVQGGIGPWHAAVIFGMMFYGFSHEQAGAFALIAHGSQMVVTILLGIYTSVAVVLQRKKIVQS
ncbi:MAG: flippase-like domain-containing protein [Bacteroidaceae bacterium]|nr:flippase-like domain-containing protein [Bacteroidaceae bacterium]